MSITQTQTEIFNQGSTTYSNSSRFFEQEVREKVTAFYAFVRVADDYVDQVPPDTEDYYNFKSSFFNSFESGTPSGNLVIDSFIDLVKEHDIPIEWIIEFFDSMEMDLAGYEYLSVGDTLKYIRGSAEVIGLMMAKILGLPEQSYKYAEMLGRSMQFINMIRDISEDITLGRSYFPRSELEKYGLFPLTKEVAEQNPDRFVSFINFQIERYEQWQAEAELGFGYISYRYRVAIQTASDKYKKTASIILANPLVVFERKVKPKKYEVMLSGIKNAILLLFKK
jgi:15-cis-phytoene synthase